MHHGTSQNTEAMRRPTTPVRNSYFYGKLLDVFHFELEQTYFNQKRWLINRLALGYGVICGLKVTPANDGTGRVRVQPGVALDKWGREIIVAEPSRPIDPSVLTDACGQPLPPASAHAYEAPLPTPMPTPTPTPPPERCVHLCIAYHECPSELAPVMTGECGTEQQCQPGVIREQYSILVRPGRAPLLPRLTCSEALDGLFDSNTINYESLVEWTLRGCQWGGEDPCIVLANVSLPDDGCGLNQNGIDMNVRPIVFTNQLLREMILCLAERCGILIDFE